MNIIVGLSDSLQGPGMKKCSSELSISMSLQVLDKKERVCKHLNMFKFLELDDDDDESINFTVLECDS